MPTDKQKRSAERRRLQRQADRRHEKAERRRRINLIVSIVGALVVIGVVIGVITATSGSDSKKAAGTSAPPAPTSTAPASSTTPTGSPATTPTRSPATTAPASKAASSAAAPPAGTSAKTVSCSYPSSGKAARTVTRPPTKAPATGTVTVGLTTSQGPMTFALDRAGAPCTVNSFVSLARQKYYDTTSCHRLVTKGIYVLQCGDPTGKGSGGPGYKFADELTGKEVYSRGVLAMANAGPDTNGSQFFIVDKNTSLGASYTIFGRVSAGLAVADKVSAAGTSDGSTDGPPKLALTFRKLTVG